MESGVGSCLSGTDGVGVGVGSGVGVGFGVGFGSGFGSGSGVGSFGISTVTLQVAVLFPSTVVTATTAVPSAFAVTFPSASTVATSSWSIEKFTCLFVAFSGATVAVSCTVWPFSVSFTSDGFSITSLTATIDSPITSASLNFACLM